MDNQTIKLILKESGSIADISYDFRLYQEAYHNKLIDIYVPVSLLIANEQNTFLNAVKTAVIMTAPNGTQLTSQGYYAEYVSRETINGKEYAVYEQVMPLEYTVYAGNHTIVANVVNIDNTDSEHPVIVRRVATQTATLTVLQSAGIDEEEIIEPSQLEVLEGQMALKQDKIDTDIQVAGVVTEQVVVPAINAINTQTTTNTGDIATQGEQITGLSREIDDIRATIIGEETPIGSMSLTTMPTDTQLTQFVIDTAGRPPKRNDVVMVTVTSNGTTTTYKYLYTVSGWIYFQVTSVSSAQNGSLGLIEGTYNESGYNYPISANVFDGKIIDLLYKDNNETYSSVKTKLNTMDTNIGHIISGAQVVGEATKATQDGNGDEISTTYAKADSVYTKSQSDDRYMPKTYSNVYYYSAEGLVESVPTTPADGVQFTANVPTSGEVELASAGRIVTGDYHFTANSTDASQICFVTDTDVTLQFRMLTYADETLLSSMLSDEIEFTANVPKTITFNAIYSNLGTTSYDLDVGGTFTKEIYVTSVSNLACGVDLVSSVQYPSSFNLVAQSVVIDINTISGLKRVNVLSSQWTQSGDIYTVMIPQTTHQQVATSEYMVMVQKKIDSTTYQYLAVTPTVDTSGNITLTSYEAVDCVVLIGSATTTDTRGIVVVTNPTVMPTIDYEQSGAIRITQTETATPLTLGVPSDASKFYTFVVSNNSGSTEDISVNGETIEAGRGIQFKWVGEWITGEEPTNTSEVYDTAKSQTLAMTLSDIDSSLNGLDHDISEVAGDVSTLEETVSGHTTSIGNINDKIGELTLGKADKDVAFFGKVESSTTLPTAVNNEIAFPSVIYTNGITRDANSKEFTITEPQDITLKAVLNFDGIAPISDYIAVNIIRRQAGVADTVVTQKVVAYNHNDPLGQIAIGKYIENASGAYLIQVHHAFESDITMNTESAISILGVVSNKVSASDNAFDIEFGVRWARDFVNKTITLKE